MFIYFHLVPLATSLTIHLRYNRITKLLSQFLMNSQKERKVGFSSSLKNVGRGKIVLQVQLLERMEPLWERKWVCDVTNKGTSNSNGSLRAEKKEIAFLGLN